MNSANSSGAEPGRLFSRFAAFGDGRLGDLAVERGWITESQLRKCQERCDLGDVQLSRLLVEEGLLTETQVRELSSKLGGLDLRGNADLPAGTPFGRFILVQEIGRGGMGFVFRAWQKDLGRWVALKRLRPEAAGSLARFIREGRLGAQVVHPNLVPIYEVGECEGVAYIAMALIEGGSLDYGQLPIRRALEVIRQIALAVQDLHVAGIIHRDIKPANILVDAAQRVYLGDFSLARQEEGAAGLTKSGFMLGTPAFAAPEQIRGAADQLGPASDVFSLGATLHALLTGAPPFSGKDAMEVAERTLHSEPPSVRSLRPEVNHQIQAIIAKAMRKNPADRYASARDFADDVQRYLDGETLVAKPPGLREKIAGAMRRRKSLIAAGAFVLVVVIAAAVVIQRQGSAGKLEAERVELGWRAEDVARDWIEWAEIRCVTRVPPATEEKVRRRTDLQAALRDIEMKGQGRLVAQAMLARFDFITGNDAAFAGLPEEPPVVVQRFRGKLARYLADVPMPGIQFTLSSEPTVAPLAGRAIASERIGAGGPLIEGCESFMAGDLERATVQLRKAAENADAHDDALRILGYAHLLGGKYSDAGAAWAKFLQRRPGRVDVRLLRGVALLALAIRDRAEAAQNLARSEDELIRAALDAPWWPDPWSWKGMIALVKSQLDPAKERDLLLEVLADFEEYRTRNGTNPALIITRASALSRLGRIEPDGRDRYREAIANLYHLLKIDTVPADRTAALLNRAGILLTLGQAELNHGDPVTAEKVLRSSIADYDAIGTETVYRGVAWAILAQALDAQSKPDDSAWNSAVTDLQEGIKSDPKLVARQWHDRGLLLQNRGVKVEGTGQEIEIWRQATEAYSRAIELAPNPQTLMLRARLEGAIGGHLQGDPPVMRTWLEKALADADRVADGPALYFGGQVAKILGMKEAARERFRKARTLSAGDAELLRKIADALSELGD